MSGAAAQATGGAGAPLRVLAVCTGNICRSPFLEERLAALVSEQTSQVLETSSAGLQAAFDFGRCDLLSASAGIPPRADRQPVQVDGELLSDFDLILALTTDHRAELLTTAPACRSRLFTLIEAANIAHLVTSSGHALQVAVDGPASHLDEHDPLRSVPPLPAEPAQRLAWLAGELDAWRGVGSSAVDPALTELLPQAAEGEADDSQSVPDPHLAVRDIHPQTATVIELAASRLAEALDATVSGEVSK